MGLFDFFKKKNVNYGTRIESYSHAVDYWRTRREAPFVMYVFNSSADAKTALLELPYIHKDSNSDNLICDYTFNFGYYGTPLKKWEAFVSGSSLTHEMWEQLHIAFKKHNGERKNDFEPEKIAEVHNASKGNAQNVMFVRDEYVPGNTIKEKMEFESKGIYKYEYKVHKATNKEDAMAFLNLQKVTKKSFYIVVETPEGTFGRDIDGIYEE